MADLTSGAFTPQGFDSPEEVRRKIGRVNSQDASAFGLNFANSLAPNTSNRKRILAQIGASFGRGLALGMGSDNEPEVQQARVRTKLLEGVNWQDKDDLTSRMRTAVAAKDHKMALFFSSKLDEIGKEELNIAREERLAKQASDRQTLAMLGEVRKQKSLDLRQDLASKKQVMDQAMMGIRERMASVAEGGLGLKREEYDSFKKLRMDNMRARTASAIADANYSDVMSGQVKGTIPDPSNSEREMVLKSLKDVDTYNTYTRGMNKNDLFELSTNLANEAAVVAYRDKISFADAFSQVYESYVNDGILGATDSWYSTLPFVASGKVDKAKMGERPPATLNKPRAVTPSGGPPKVGDVVSGYEFLGGDPSDQNNWKKK